MLDYLNLPNVKTLRVHDVDEQEILVDVEGGVRPTRCPDVNCSGEHLVGNGSNTVVIRDIPRDGKWVWIRLRRRRVKCTICGRTASFHVNAFHPDRQMTIRLVLSIQQACLQETCASLSRRIGVDEGTIRDIAKAHIAHLDRSLSFGVPSVLGLDEFKIYGRPSAILTNIEARTIYDVLETRTAVHLRPVFEQIAASGQLEVVVTDMFEAYLRLVGQIAPRTPVVIDRFHVVRMANDAMERVRRRVQVRLAPEERKRLKRERGVFLSNAADLLPEAVALRDAWFGEAPELRAAYEAKEAFHTIYHAASRDAAERAFLLWRETLSDPGKRDFMQAGYAFSTHRVPILNYFEHRYTAGFTESVNRLAKDINRLGRGYSWEVLRARLLHHKYARDQGARKIKRRVIDDLFATYATGRITGAGLRDRWEMVEDRWGVHVPTLLAAIRDFPDYRPADPGEEEFNLS